MSNTSDELGKLLSATGSVIFAGAGIASLFTGGFAPLLWGSASFVLAGASGLNLLAMDKAGMLKEEKEEALKELASAKEKLRIAESEFRSELSRVTAERNDYKHRLETEVAEFKVRCQKLKDDIEYWETGMHPAIIELPPIKEFLGTLKGKLLETSEKLESALIQIISLKEENRILKIKIEELEATNDEIDSEIAAKMLELAQLKTNFDYKLRDELHKTLQPYCNQAVTTALERKLAEIDKLKQAIAMLQEDIGNYQQVMDGLEKETLPDIEKTYKSEMNEADSKLMQLAGQNELLQQQLANERLPRKFPGYTNASNIGNHIIDHFAAHGVIFDAHTALVIVGGYSLKFWYHRTADNTKISAEEFGKIRSQVGLHGLSHKELQFEIDLLNLIVEVEVFTNLEISGPGQQSNNTRTSGMSPLSTVGGVLSTVAGAAKQGKSKSGKAVQRSYVRVANPDIHREKFVELGCYPADQFGEVVRQKFVTRVRVCAGSTGGKSPILEMVAIELAKANSGVIWLLNPIPGSEKDWFKIPGIIQPGTDANAKIVEVFEDFHAEFQSRRNNLPSVKGKDFLLLAVDEDNATAREYEEIGTFIKDMYQLSDHVNMGFVSAGQGNNVSGLSGGGAKKGKGDEENTKKRTGNATKLMKEDFQNAVRIYTSEQAYAYLQATPFKNRAELLEKLTQLNELCEQLNQEEGLMSRPVVGQAKKVSPEAYRIAFVVSPACEPFFIQLPAYSSLSLDGLRFPAEAKVTSPHWKSEVKSDRLLHAFDACPHCLSTAFHTVKPYADGTTRFECGNSKCRKKFGRS